MNENNRQRRRAVALRYEPTKDTAPVLVAKGSGALADRIIQLAKQNNVPIREDRNLVQVLGMLNIDQQIPPEAYQAVATILMFLYQLQQPRKPAS